MKIKLTKSAIIGGAKQRAGTIHELPDRRALKLINRGYAATYSKEEPVEEQAEDGDTVSE